METLNCMRCKYRHEDNGNCTAVGGFCTAVPAAHCPLLRDFLDAGLTPAEVHSMSGEWGAMMSVLNGIGSYDRLRELAEADKNGHVVVLPCKVGDTVYYRNGKKRIIDFEVTGFSVDDTGAWLIHVEHHDNEKSTSYRYSLDTDKIGKTVFLTREEAEAHGYKLRESIKF